jgi:hypothetical protein
MVGTETNRTGIGAGLLSDVPEERDEYLWGGLKSLRDQLADELGSFPVTSPVLISGDWGAGKTTLLKALRRRIDPNASEKNRIPGTLFFEAWRYERESLLLPALIRAIWQCLPKEVQPSPHWCRQLWNSAVAVASGLGPELAKIAGGPWGAIVAGLLAGRQHEVASESSEPPVASESSEPPQDETEKLWEGFGNLLKNWDAERPLIIFIDDLDRCSPEGAVALLDAIRMLLNYATSLPADDSRQQLPCRFVVALDRTVLAQAVARKFSDLSRYEGNRYLEKIFPLAFDMPRPEGSEVHHFVTTFLRMNRSMTSEVERGPQIADEELDALSLALSDRIFANPRLMKHCINRFRLVRRFEAQPQPGVVDGDGDDIEEDIEARTRQLVVLTKWIAATARWPHLRRLLSRRGDDYWRRFREALTGGEERLPDSEAKELLKDEGIEIWLRREMFGGKGTRLIGYREADQRLRRWGL